MIKLSKSGIAGLATLLCLVSCGEKSTRFQGGKGADANQVEAIALTQAERQVFSENFSQDMTFIDRKDKFIQGETQAPLDLLVIIDNSSSMSEEQMNLAGKLGPLLTSIADSDWQISVVTTDISDPCQRAMIHKNDPNKDQVFATAINAGTLGNSTELGYYKAVEGLRGDCLPTPWVRDNSTIAVLIISDEDNCSNSRDRTNCLGTGSRDSGYLLSYLSSIRTPGTDARVYGIISHPSSPCATADNISEEYANIIATTHGTWGDICESDYSATLASISQDIGDILRTRFALKSPPVQSSVQVMVDGIEISADQYTVLNYSIRFLMPPPAGSNIEIYYESTKVKLQTKFPLANQASNVNAVVTINGELYPAESYYVDEANQMLVFKDPPAVNTAFEIEYRELEPLPESFMIRQGLDEDRMICFINRKPVNEFTYDSKSGVLAFESVPPDGAEILIEFE